MSGVWSWRRAAVWACGAAFLLLLAAYLHNTAPDTPTQPAPPHHLPLTLHSNNNTINEERVPWWDGGGCRCEGRVCAHQEPPSQGSVGVVGGTCGRRAWAAGDGQRVVSFSLYGDNPEYWLGLNDTLQRVGEMYRGWVVRLYTTPHAHAAHLCPLLTRYAHFYVCDVTNLPPPLGNISGVHPMMWRVAPLGDPQLAALMVRDTDSQVSERERAAVEAWLATGKHFHVMRDHPSHDAQILGGMWGARWDLGSDPRPHTAHALAALRDTMLREARGQTQRGQDQKILGKWLWPVMVGRMVAHDSYNCLQFPGTIPWPTQRVHGYFVGSPSFRKKYANQTVPKPCPVRCRPKLHRDWLYC
nr:uncharacterized protein LOC123749642 [Procambarus clarkii]